MDMATSFPIPLRHLREDAVWTEVVRLLRLASASSARVTQGFQMLRESLLPPCNSIQNSAALCQTRQEQSTSPMQRRENDMRALPRLGESCKYSVEKAK